MLFPLTTFNPWLVAVTINTIFFGIAAILPKKLLTPAGYLHAWVLGVLVWGVGFPFPPLGRDCKTNAG